MPSFPLRLRSKWSIKTMGACKKKKESFWNVGNFIIHHLSRLITSDSETCWENIRQNQSDSLDYSRICWDFSMTWRRLASSMATKFTSVFMAFKFCWKLIIINLWGFSWTRFSYATDSPRSIKKPLFYTLNKVFSWNLIEIFATFHSCFSPKFFVPQNFS